MSDTRCAHCGGPLDAHGRGISNRGRPPKFCSVRCKEAARVARRQAGRTNRTCRHCGGPIDLTRTGKAIICSRECGIAYQNAVRAEAKRATKLAHRKPCEACGASIPEALRAGTKYCSKRCKNHVAAELWRQRAPTYMRQYLYDITGEQFEALLASQGGGCAICGTTDWPGKGNAPHVDHDPAKGRTAVRGILCGNCNNGLGNFKDDPTRLRAAAAYLERTWVTS